VTVDGPEGFSPLVTQDEGEEEDEEKGEEKDDWRTIGGRGGGPDEEYEV
jgi:hypothetical protein